MSTSVDMQTENPLRKDGTNTASGARVASAPCVSWPQLAQPLKLGIVVSAVFLVVALIVAFVAVGRGSGASSVVITTTMIENGAVSAEKLAANAVTSSSLATGAVIAAALASGAVTAEAVATAAITSNALSTGSVNAAALASNSVTTAAIADGAVATSDLADGAVTGTKIGPAAVLGSNLGTGIVNPYPVRRYTVSRRLPISAGDSAANVKMLIQHSGYPMAVFSVRPNGASTYEIWMVRCTYVDCSAFQPTVKLVTGLSDAIGLNGMDAFIASDGSLVVGYEQSTKLFMVSASGTGLATIATPVQLAFYTNEDFSSVVALQTASDNQFSVVLDSGTVPDALFLAGSASGVYSVYCSTLACASPSTPFLLTTITGTVASVRALVSPTGAITFAVLSSSGALTQNVCNLKTCTSGTTTTNSVVTGVVTSGAPQFALVQNAAAAPVFIYMTKPSTTLNLVTATCSTYDCSTAPMANTAVSGMTDANLLSVGGMLAPNGMIRLFYNQLGSSYLYSTVCDKDDCSSTAYAKTIAGHGAVVTFSATYGVDGNPILAFKDSNNDLWVQHCGTPDCSRVW